MLKFFIKISLLLIPCLGFSQGNRFGLISTSIDTIAHEFYYDYNYQRDSSDSSNETYQEMILQVGKRHSKFCSVNSLRTDSVKFALEGLSRSVALQKFASVYQESPTATLCRYYVFKDFPEKKQINFIANLGTYSSINVTEKASFDWKFVEGDTTILTYSCHKAICSYGGRDYIAWFTPDIPISDGPYKFSGLPGLIVRLSDTNKEHAFELYKLKESNNKREMFFIRKDDLSETTPQGYCKALKKHQRDKYMKWGGNSNLQHDSPDGEAKMLRNIRSKNNFIERY